MAFLDGVTLPSGAKPVTASSPTKSGFLNSVSLPTTQEKNNTIELNNDTQDAAQAMQEANDANSITGMFKNTVAAAGNIVKGFATNLIQQYTNPDQFEQGLEKSAPPILRQITAPVVRTVAPMVEPTVNNVAASIVLNTPSLYSKFSDEAAKGMFATAPGVEPTDQAAAGNAILDVTKKTPVQIVGDTVQSVLGAYAPDLFGESLDAFAAGGARQAVTVAMTHGATTGFTFGAAQVASSGTKDPLQAGKILLQSTVGGAVLSLATSMVSHGIASSIPDALQKIKTVAPDAETKVPFLNPNPTADTPPAPSTFANQVHIPEAKTPEYEGYTAQEDLPVIEAGPGSKDESGLPIIKANAPKTSRVPGDLTIEPVDAGRPRRVNETTDQIQKSGPTGGRTSGRQAVKAAAAHDIEKLSDEYIKKNGNIVNTDDARELFASYRADRTTSAAVHEEASAVAKRAYQKLLDTKQGEGNNTVLFTAGGTGAGKTSAVRALGNPEDFPVIYDTNTNKTESASSKIDAALEKGYKVKIAYVYNDLNTSLDNALDRADTQRGQLGSGRTVPVDEHLKTHLDSPETVLALAEKYKDNPNVDFEAIDNEKNRAQTVDKSDALAFVRQKVYDRANDSTRLEQLKERIRGSDATDETKKGFLGESSGEGARPSNDKTDDRRDAARIQDKEAQDNVRGLAKSVDRDAIASGLKSGLGNLPEYRHMDMNEQAKMAGDLIKRDPELAMKVALGEVPSPVHGLHSESVYTAIRIAARDAGDVEVLRQLATQSSIVSDATTLGQRIKALDSGQETDPVSIIQDVKAAREKSVGTKKIAKETKIIADDIKNSIKKSSSGRVSWEEFVKEIQCAY